MIVLNETDILKSIRFNELLECIEKAWIIQEEGDYYMPDRIHLNQEKNVHLVMPAGVPDYLSTKLVSLFPENKKRNKPVLHGVVLLQDGQTGEYLALLNGAKLTALRTGAVGALGLAFTTPRELDSVGLIGTGVQGFHQVLMAASVRLLKTVFLYDHRRSGLKDFVKSVSKWLPDVQFVLKTDVSDLLEKTDAIITATTSLDPVLPEDAARLKGKHFIGIGSYRPDMREYPDALYPLLDQVYMDTPLAQSESGDISMALKKGLIQEKQLITMGKVINGSVHPDLSGTTFFKSVGMALFDLLTAQKMVENALKMGLGQKINF